jgi:hypothetical protein
MPDAKGILPLCPCVRLYECRAPKDNVMVKKKGVRLALLATVVVAGVLVTAAVLILTTGERAQHCASCANPLVFSASPYAPNGSAGNGALPAACTRVFGLNIEDVSVGSSTVHVGIAPGPGVEVKRVFITVSARRPISATAYTRCVHALPHNSGGARPLGHEVVLPGHGSIVLLPGRPSGGGFLMTVTAPPGRRSAPIAYIWHVSVLGSSSAYGALEPSSLDFVTLTPPT